jgi:cell wall-associated NlpC family hydrolase
MELYAVAETPTPVLNTPDFPSVFGGSDGKSLPLDESGLVRQLEFIALPGTVFGVIKSMPVSGVEVYEVATDEYPYPSNSGYYVDARFVRTVRSKPNDRPKKMPPKEAVLAKLLAVRGSKYVWGGNVPEGVPRMLEMYLPNGPITPQLAEKWTLKGLDCSGLLYHATCGFSPRNASSLVTFGRTVNIAGLDAEAIAKRLRPLDLIAWHEHVIIVLDRETTIESCLDCADNPGDSSVHLRSLRDVLRALTCERVAVNRYWRDAAAGEKRFVVRRWIK